MASYIDILNDWEKNVINKYLYESINIFFPSYGFVRVDSGGAKDHWASPLKINLSTPKVPTREKTVVYPVELCFREQGDWSNKVSVVDKIVSDYSLNSIYEAYKFVADRLGIAMPSTDGIVKDNRKRDERLLSLLEDYFIWNLWHSNNKKCTEALAYLRDQRAYSLSEIKEMKLGFVPAWRTVENYITNPRYGFSIGDLDRVCGVRNEKGWTNIGDEYLVAIPYRSAGSIKGFLFRSIDTLTKPKYRATRALDRKSTLFNLEDSQNLGRIIIVEGELDALGGTVAGIRGLVSIGGSELSGERNRMLYDVFNRNVQKIVLCLDLDEDRDGRPDYAKRFNKNRRSILEILNIMPDFRELYIAELPYCTDPDRFIRENGASEFVEIVDKAKTWWTYLSDHMEGVGE